MDVTYFASYREDACGVASRAIIKEQGIFTCRSFGIWPAMPHRLEQIAGPMSALPQKADIERHNCSVRFVPKADLQHRSKNHRYSITSSAAARMAYSAGAD